MTMLGVVHLSSHLSVEICSPRLFADAAILFENFVLVRIALMIGLIEAVVQAIHRPFPCCLTALLPHVFN